MPGLLFVLGLALLAAGGWLVTPALGLAVAGAACCLVAVSVERARQRGARSTPTGEP